MISENIIREIISLPPEIQQQVADYVEFLKNRYPPVKSVRKVRQNIIVDEPFIGMWQNREDIQDSTEWVRKLRQREWI